MKQNISISDFISQIKNNSLVIWGTGNTATETLIRLHRYMSFSKKQEMLDTIHCFIDNSIVKNKFKIKFKHGLEKTYDVKTPDYLRSCVSENYIILICSTAWMQILNQLETMNISLEKLKIVTYDEIQYFFQKESFAYLYYRIIEPSLIQYKTWLIANEYKREEILDLVFHKEEYLTKSLISGKVIIPALSIAVTNKCTLNCKNCIDLIPHYKKHWDYDVNSVISGIERILNAAEEVVCVHMVSGEAMRYPHIIQILKLLIASDKIGFIVLTTNGTTFPDEILLNLLKSQKVMVNISDYGMIGNLGNLVELFEKNNIKFNVLSNMKWLSVGQFPERRDLVPSSLIHKYQACETGRLCSKLLDNNRFYGCGRIGKFHDLEVCDSQKDGFNLTDNIDLNRKGIMDVLLLDYLDGCQYCEITEQKDEVEPAVQIGDREFKRSKYTIVKR